MGTTQDRGLDLRFLERSVQQQESARQRFLRDLKIVGFLLLAFQFLVFFRFIDLSDRQEQLGAEVAQLGADREAVGEIQAQLTSLGEALQAGKNQLTEELRQAPESMRKQVQALETYIRILREGPPVGPPIGPGDRGPSPAGRGNVAFQAAPDSAPAPFTPLIAEELRVAAFAEDLSGTEMETLRKAKPEEKGFKDLVERIVNKTIVQPTLDDLNEMREAVLEKPFVQGKSQLLAALDSQRGALERHGLTAGTIRQKLNQVQQSLHTFQFTAPGSEPWWRTYAGKGELFRAQRIVAHEVVLQVSHVLEKPGQDLDSLVLRLAALLEERELAKRDLEGQLRKLEANLGTIQSRLETFAKPLSVVALEPRDAVVYYPVVLAAAFAFFVWRYVRLHRRVSSLAAAYREFGLSDEVLKVYLADYPGFTDAAVPQRTVWGYPAATGLRVVLCATPGILAGVSLYRILTSPSLMSAAPSFVYAIAAVCFVATYSILIAPVLRAPRRRNVHGKA